MNTFLEYKYITYILKKNMKESILIQVIATDFKCCRDQSGLCPTKPSRAGLSTHTASDDRLGRLGRQTGCRQCSTESVTTRTSHICLFFLKFQSRHVDKNFYLAVFKIIFVNFLILMHVILR